MGGSRGTRICSATTLRQGRLRNASMSGTRFYYLHPLLAGPIDRWPDHLDRAAAMGFDAVVTAPPFLPGPIGNLFLSADHDRLDPRLGGGDALTALKRLAEAAVRRGLRPILDVVI